MTPDEQQATAEAHIPPYFDVLLTLLAENDPETVLAFGRHVHWGYWENTSAADGTACDYAQAAERLCRRICDAAQIAPGMSVLDAGCGFGGTIASLNERLTGLRLCGLNIDERQLARAAQCVLPRAGNQIEWVLGNACALPLAEASFDRILAVECLFHMDRQVFLMQAARVLRPGGLLAVSDFLPASELVAAAGRSNASLNDALARTYGRLDVTYPLQRYRQAAEAAGLELRRQEDLTPHTLPTYAFLRNHIAGWREPGQAEMFDRATALLEAGSQMGGLRYMILVFSKTPRAL